MKCYVLGGICTAWFWNPEFPLAVESREGGIFPVASAKRSPFSADLFGSVCYTFQHGKFRKIYGDLTRVDARLDISSASALAQRVFNVLSGSSVSSFRRPSSSPRVNLIFQQQVLYCT